VLAIVALLQGWLLCVGFVCLANVLQCAVAIRDFALNVLSLEGERNVAVGLRTTLGICAVGGLIHSSPPATAAERRTKVQNIFCCIIVKVKLGQKAEQRAER